MASAINQIDKQIILNTDVQQDGTVSLNIVSRSPSMAGMDKRALAPACAFLSIDSFFTLAQVNRRTSRAVKDELVDFAYPIKPESANCSRLLTGVWNLTFAREQNRREALTKISHVAIQSGILVLNTPVKNGGYRYIDPATFSSLQEKLMATTQTWKDKVRCVKSLITSAIAFPPHLCVEMNTNPRYYELPIHDYCKNQVISYNDALFKIERVINYKNNEERLTIIFQMMAISDPTEEERRSVNTIEQFRKELATALPQIETVTREIATAQLLAKADTSQDQFALIRQSLSTSGLEQTTKSLLLAVGITLANEKDSPGASGQT